MLADSSLSNLRLITRELLSMHHQSDPSLCKEFDVRPHLTPPPSYAHGMHGDLNYSSVHHCH